LGAVLARFLTRFLTRFQVFRFNVCRLLTLPRGFNERPYWMRGLQFEHSYAIEFRDPVELYADKGYSGFDFYRCDRSGSELS
jgi:hypothetical protein